MHRFIRITVEGEQLYVRADQVLAIEEGRDKTLVRMAYLPPGMAIETPMLAREIIRRLNGDVEEFTGTSVIEVPG